MNSHSVSSVDSRSGLSSSRSGPFTLRLDGRQVARRLAGLAILLAAPGCATAETTVVAPVAKIDAPSTARQEVAIFAGGCFWGVEGVLAHVKGVTSAVSGYAGPSRAKVSYETVSSGTTGFAEAVRVTYDPRVVSYGTLMRVFFSVVADPTSLNFQGPDHGTQYRTALFPQNAAQARAAQAYIAQLGKAGLWRAPIVTRVESLTSFQPAEAYHQDFLELNPDYPYIVAWDAPKLAAFKASFPTLYRARASR